jgi:hypothetical protein
VHRQLTPGVQKALKLFSAVNLTVISATQSSPGGRLYAAASIRSRLIVIGQPLSSLDVDELSVHGCAQARTDHQIWSSGIRPRRLYNSAHSPAIPALSLVAQVCP